MAPKVGEDDEGNGYASKNAYATLLTRPSYLAGTILLAYSLRKHSPSTPLIIMYTPETLPESSIKALETESHASMSILVSIDHLRLPKTPGTAKDGMVAERFIDTWTKLRVFELHEMGFEKVCFLDADMLIFRDPSPLIFGPELRDDEMMATHVCVCNLDHDAWAPSDWKPENCSWTNCSSPDDVPPATNDPPTHGMMNTGTFVFRATPKMQQTVLGAFESTPVSELQAMKFPDQDFLNMVFSGKWRSLSWAVNSLKTWRNWHPNIWRDDRVCVLHYIVDKPWAKRVGPDGVAGYKGLDGETHSWWWKEYERWRAERLAEGDELNEGEGEEEVRIVEQYVASADGKENEEMKAIGGGAQDYAKKWQKKEEEEEKSDEKGLSDDPKKKMLGERGHGPVTRSRNAQFSASANQPKLKGQAKGSSFMADG